GFNKNQFQNIGDHSIKGVELEARWQASKNINLSANYTQREQDDSDFRAVQEADQEAYIRTDWVFSPDWNWNVQANWIGQRERPSTDDRSHVEAYVVTDTTLRFAASDNWELAASVRNLFDESAREYTGRSIADDLPLPGRNAYVEARYKF
ncbi:MAG TPA: TonB-dependent receptor, partial [Gammaproteobacteria bacterium]|nr:TonB-dependent receptor [Gammaproteobacteria bacterium]